MRWERRIFSGRLKSFTCQGLSGAVQLGTNAVLPLAPLSLPYSPEFEPRSDLDEGRKTLREIARITGGVERTTWDDVFTSTRVRNRQVRDLVMPLTLMLLVLHVVEIGCGCSAPQMGGCELFKWERTW
jgi:hypothetical protein